MKSFYFVIGLAMRFILQPWQLLFIILAALVNQRQQQVNEFQRTQIEVLLEKLGKKAKLSADLDIVIIN